MYIFIKIYVRIKFIHTDAEGHGKWRGQRSTELRKQRVECNYVKLKSNEKIQRSVSGHVELVYTFNG